MSKPSSIITLLDFAVREDNSTEPQMNMRFRWHPELLCFKVKYLVEETLNKKEVISNKDSLKISVSLGFSEICYSLIEPFLTSLIIESIYRDHDTPVWFPINNLVNKCNDNKERFSTEEEYVTCLYSKYNMTNNGSLSKAMIFKLLVTFIVNSFLLAWRGAGHLCGYSDALMIKKKENVIQVFERMLSMIVPPECLDSVRKQFNISINNWEKLFLSNKQDTLTNQALILKGKIDASNEWNDGELGRIDEMKEEIKRMEEKLKIWEGEYKSNVSRTRGYQNRLTEIEKKKSIYVLGYVCRDLRQYLVEEETEYSGLYYGSMFHVCCIISNKRNNIS